MALGDATNRIEYAGNNSTVTAYAVPFRFDAASWLVVRRITNLGVVTTLANGVDYALTGNTTTGDGEITTTVAIPANNTLVFSRYTPAFQTLSLVPNSPLPAADLEAALDRLIMALQDRDTNGGLPFSRAIIFPISEPDSHDNILPNPALRKGHILYFNATTGEMETLSQAALITLLGEGFRGLTGDDGDDGDDGTDGREIELQASVTHIQWRFVGEVSWTNLIALSSITGPAGTNGTNGTNGAGFTAGTTAGDIKYWDGAAWVNLAAPAAPGANQLNILIHNGTAPSWSLVAETELDYCDGGTPATGTFLEL
jgi:hypothetical protein